MSKYAALIALVLLTLACTVSTVTPNASPASNSELKNAPKASTATELPLTSTVSFVVANCERVNVRTCAGTLCAGVDVLPVGSEVIRVGNPVVLEDASTWVQVRSLDVDVTGWVNARYLEEIQ